MPVSALGILDEQSPVHSWQEVRYRNCICAAIAFLSSSNRHTPDGFARVNFHLPTHIPDPMNGLHQEFHQCLTFLVDLLRIYTRPGRDHNALPSMGQVLPYLLAQEGHKGMQEFHCMNQNMMQYSLSGKFTFRALLFVQPRLDQVQYTSRILIPNKLIEDTCSLTQFIDI